MKRLIVLLFLTVLLAGCGGADKEQNAFIDLNNTIDSQLDVVDEEWNNYLNAVKSFESDEITQEEFVKKITEAREGIIKASDTIYAYETDDEQLKSVKESFAAALFEQAKIIGHHRNYVTLGEEHEYQQVLKRLEAYEKDFEKAINQFNEVKSDLGL